MAAITETSQPNGDTVATTRKHRLCPLADVEFGAVNDHDDSGDEEEYGAEDSLKMLSMLPMR